MVASLALLGSYLLAFAGFLVMLAAALFFQRNLYKIGRAGRQQWLDSMRASGVKDYRRASRRVRDRLSARSSQLPDHHPLRAPGQERPGSTAADRRSRRAGAPHPAARARRRAATARSAASSSTSRAPTPPPWPAPPGPGAAEDSIPGRPCRPVGVLERRLGRPPGHARSGQRLAHLVPRHQHPAARGPGRPPPAPPPQPRGHHEEDPRTAATTRATAVHASRPGHGEAPALAAGAALVLQQAGRRRRGRPRRRGARRGGGGRHRLLPVGPGLLLGHPGSLAAGDATARRRLERHPAGAAEEDLGQAWPWEPRMW